MRDAKNDLNAGIVYNYSCELRVIGILCYGRRADLELEFNEIFGAN